MNTTDSGVECALRQVESFADRVSAAANLLFAKKGISRDVGAVLRRLREDVGRLMERGGASVPAIAIVGRVGEGKSWLARTFIDASKDAALRAEIHSGQNDTDRTCELVWFGPEKPFGLRDSGERYLDVASSFLLDLGRPYIVGDTPGFNDPNPRAWQLAGVAVTSAPVKILVTSISQLRDGGVEHFVAEMGGALILPVVRFEPDGPGVVDPTESTRKDVLVELDKWRSYSPRSEILDPCFMPAKAVFGEKQAEKLMRDRLRAALQPVLSQPELLQNCLEHQIDDRLRRARGEIAKILLPFRQRVGSSVARMEEMTTLMSRRIQLELQGEEAVLCAAIRQRLRADWLERTSSFCFPFRTFAGLFALTHGAWDRLFFSALGSMPSLAATLFKTVRNVNDAIQISASLHNGLEERMNRLLAEEFRPVVRDFESAVVAVLPLAEASEKQPQPVREALVRCRGLLDLQAVAAGILRDEITRHRAAGVVVWLFALVGSGSAVWLLSGPVVSLYRTYLQAHDRAISEVVSMWSDFPQPTFSMIFASLLLSFAPACFLALIAMSWCSLGSRVRRIATAFRDKLERETAGRLRNHSLEIELDEPRLDAARQLIGATDVNDL